MLKVTNISFSYKKLLVLDNISFQVNKGEHLSVIGQSGSGKSTLLKLLYGVYDLNKGGISWNNQAVKGPKHNLITDPEFMKYVSQEFNLMPFITIQESIGMYLSNFFVTKKNQRIEELLKIVDLQNYAHTKIKELSGGQKQRVALARAIALEPEIILLDEPFSHIDNFKKNSLRRSFFRHLKKKGITCIVATHDKNDVLGFAEKVLVLQEAQIMRQGTPQNLFEYPKHPLVASFFGEYNIIKPHGVVYANQLKILETSNLKAIVIDSYFKGDYWLIEADYDSNKIYLEHITTIDKGQLIYFEILPVKRF
ncbi:ABC transporter ATP-binding protein [Flavobacteriaceae bacterium]|jgi:iron(III) transport system ATP-binding protein|nr:ABC transporter ATP-binding protein [Flavobacteriaceae bacterium]